VWGKCAVFNLKVVLYIYRYHRDEVACIGVRIPLGAGSSVALFVEALPGTESAVNRLVALKSTAQADAVQGHALSCVRMERGSGLSVPVPVGSMETGQQDVRIPHL
jgi:hypothetical protein